MVERLHEDLGYSRQTDWHYVRPEFNRRDGVISPVNDKCLSRIHLPDSIREDYVGIQSLSVIELYAEEVRGQYFICAIPEGGGDLAVVEKDASVEDVWKLWAEEEEGLRALLEDN